jgi:transcriptional regulator with XRE-family HTH domain
MTGEVVFSGRKLRGWRLRRAMTLRALGEAAGVRYPAIHRLETSDRQPRPSTVAKLAAALAIDPADLFDTGEPEADPEKAAGEE